MLQAAPYGIDGKFAVALLYHIFFRSHVCGGWPILATDGARDAFALNVNVRLMNVTEIHIDNQQNASVQKVCIVKKYFISHFYWPNFLVWSRFQSNRFDFLFWFICFFSKSCFRLIFVCGGKWISIRYIQPKGRGEKKRSEE